MGAQRHWDFKMPQCTVELGGLQASCLFPFRNGCSVVKRAPTWCSSSLGFHPESIVFIEMSKFMCFGQISFTHLWNGHWGDTIKWGHIHRSAPRPTQSSTNPGILLPNHPSDFFLPLKGYWASFYFPFATHCHLFSFSFTIHMTLPSLRLSLVSGGVLLMSPPANQRAGKKPCVAFSVWCLCSKNRGLGASQRRTVAFCRSPDFPPNSLWLAPFINKRAGLSLLLALEACVHRQPLSCTQCVDHTIKHSLFVSFLQVLITLLNFSLLLFPAMIHFQKRRQVVPPLGSFPFLCYFSF